MNCIRIGKLEIWYEVLKMFTIGIGISFEGGLHVYFLCFWVCFMITDEDSWKV